jgi:rfaE bifunctional protein nucleotidyltransferase chain/domain
MKVFTNGCFDVLHRGHIELLSYCANIGEVLVGLNSDKSVKRLKGNDRPVNNEKDRKIILESIRYVNEVIIFEEDTPYELIKILKPDLIVKGGDYLPNDVVGYDLCEVRIFDTLKGYSSTAAINSLLAKKYYE